MAIDPWEPWQAFAASFGGLFGGAGGAGAQGAAAFVPAAELAERFKTAAQDFLGATPASAAPPAQAARLFGDALRDLFAHLQPPWTGSPSSTPGSAPAFSADSLAMGATREHQLRWQRLSEAWRQLDEGQRRLQRLWTDALREAAIDFAMRLGQPAAAAPGPETLRHLYETWIDCAEQAYARIAHGASYCDALAETVNAGSRWRRELKAMVEQSAQLLDLPTRSELNTLHQRLHAVEAVVRDAQRPGGAPQPGGARQPGESPARPRKKAPAKGPKRRGAKR